MNTQRKEAEPNNIPRPVHAIAKVTIDNWRASYIDAKKIPAFVSYAWPYLEAMQYLKTTSRDEKYGFEDAQMIALYFLNNATGWKGEFAKAIKKELNERLKNDNF